MIGLFLGLHPLLLPGHIQNMTDMPPPYHTQLILDGPDTISLLERLVTCRVDDICPGEQRSGALLTPQGKVVADFYLTRTQTGCTLLVHADVATDLEKRLKMFRLRAQVEISKAEFDAPILDEAARIGAGLPVFALDFITAQVFPTDINLDIRGGIDYKKGCFVGQEVVSRMKRRGKIRKRTIALSGERLSKNDMVYAGDKVLGQITSGIGTSALAVLRIDHLSEALATGLALTCNGRPVQMQVPEWLFTEMKALKTNVQR